MKVFLYEDKFKYIAEPYFLESYSGKMETILFVPVSGEWLIKDEAEKIIRFPEDIDKLDLSGRFNSRWDYSMLPDHGIEDYLNPNIYSPSRKGRIYKSLNSDYIKRNLPEKYLKLPEFSRNQKNFEKDMEVLRIKFRVENFIELF